MEMDLDVLKENALKKAKHKGRNISTRKALEEFMLLHSH